MEKRITGKDLLHPDHEVIAIFFNELCYQSIFVRCLEHFSQGIGVGLAGARCSLPDKNDPEEQFEGVRFVDLLNEDSPFFSADGTALYVDNETFYHYLTLATANHLELHPNEDKKIKNLIQQIYINMNINQDKLDHMRKTGSQ